MRRPHGDMRLLPSSPGVVSKCRLAAISPARLKGLDVMSSGGVFQSLLSRGQWGIIHQSTRLDALDRTRLPGRHPLCDSAINGEYPRRPLLMTAPTASLAEFYQIRAHRGRHAWEGELSKTKRHRITNTRTNPGSPHSLSRSAFLACS